MTTNVVTTAAGKAQSARDALFAEDAAQAAARAERDRLAAEAETATLELQRVTEQRRREAATVMAVHAHQQLEQAGNDISAALAEFRASVAAGPLAPLARWMDARLRAHMWAGEHEAALNTLGAPHVTMSQPVPPSLDGADLAEMLARALADGARERVAAEGGRLAEARRHYIEGVTETPLPD